MHVHCYVYCIEHVLLIIVLLFIGGGVDYTTVLMNVTFSVGDTYQLFNISLTNDNTLEQSEHFEVVIKAIHLIGEQQPIPPVVLGAITVANGTILDDDGKLDIFISNNS